jgi:hypothetical protein
MMPNRFPEGLMLTILLVVHNNHDQHTAGYFPISDKIPRSKLRGILSHNDLRALISGAELRGLRALRSKPIAAHRIFIGPNLRGVTGETK